jgi:hypothetical protein
VNLVERGVEEVSRRFEMAAKKVFDSLAFS